jgi:hypothetical protein
MSSLYMLSFIAEYYQSLTKDHFIYVCKYKVYQIIIFVIIVLNLKWTQNNERIPGKFITLIFMCLWLSVTSGASVSNQERFTDQSDRLVGLEVAIQFHVFQIVGGDPLLGCDINLGR